MDNNQNQNGADEPYTIRTIGKELFAFWPDIYSLAKKVIDLDKAEQLELVSEEEKQEELRPLVESLNSKFDEAATWLDGQIVYLEYSETFEAPSHVERERNAVEFFAMLEAHRSFSESTAYKLELHQGFIGAGHYASSLAKAARLVEQKLEDIRAASPGDCVETFFAEFNAYNERLQKGIERIQWVLALPDDMIRPAVQDVLEGVGSDLSNAAQFLFAQMRIVRDPSCISGETLTERASRAKEALSIFENVRTLASAFQKFFEGPEDVSSDYVRALDQAIGYLRQHVARFTPSPPVIQKPLTGRNTNDRVKDFLKKHPPSSN